MDLRLVHPHLRRPNSGHAHAFRRGEAVRRVQDASRRRLVDQRGQRRNLWKLVRVVRARGFHHDPRMPGGSQRGRAMPGGWRWHLCGTVL